MRAAESGLDPEGLPPRAALARLVEFTVDGHARNPDVIRLVMIETIHRAQAWRQSTAIRDRNAGAIRLIGETIRRGEAAGAFRPGLDATALHWQIGALCVFIVSNRPTVSASFGETLFDAAGQELLRDKAVEMALARVRPPETL